MTNHLSTDQISRLVGSDATPEEIQHARNCAQCAAEITEFRETLSIFREAVQQWTDQSSGSVVPDSAFLRTESHSFAVPRLAWGVAFAVLIFLVVFPAYKNINHHREPGPDDALLLEQVNAHLSRTVPAPMEPLMELLSDGSADEAGGRQ